MRHCSGIPRSIAFAVAVARCSTAAAKIPSISCAFAGRNSLRTGNLTSSVGSRHRGDRLNGIETRLRFLIQPWPRSHDGRAAKGAKAVCEAYPAPNCAPLYRRSSETRLAYNVCSSFVILRRNEPGTRIPRVSRTLDCVQTGMERSPNQQAVRRPAMRRFGLPTGPSRKRCVPARSRPGQGRLPSSTRYRQPRRCWYVSWPHRPSCCRV